MEPADLTLTNLSALMAGMRVHLVSLILFLTMWIKVGFAGQLVEYEHKGVTLEGYHAFDGGVEGARPGVLIVHQWTGISDHEKERADRLADLGYNVFVADVYGAGVRPQPPAAGDEAGKYKADRELFRERMLAGLEILKADERTDAGRVAAIGYCFGGTGVLELARAGEELQGVVSFHGGLGAGDGMGAEEGGVAAKILCFHGAADPYVPPAEVSAFKEEMTEAGADWQFVSFSDAVHSFTQRSAGSDPSKGVAYDALADERSWEYMKVFFAEIF